MSRRLAVLLGCPALAGIITYRRGYAAPLLFGARLWWSVCTTRPESEPEVIA